MVHSASNRHKIPSGLLQNRLQQTRSSLLFQNTPFIKGEQQDLPASAVVRVKRYQRAISAEAAVQVTADIRIGNRL